LALFNINFSVGDLQQSIGKLQLPVPYPRLFLTHVAADVRMRDHGIILFALSCLSALTIFYRSAAGLGYRVDIDSCIVLLRRTDPAVSPTACVHPYELHDIKLLMP